MPRDTTIFRTQHTHSTKLDNVEKLKRLRTWKHWRNYGMKGRALEKRSKLSLERARQWAAELNFDLGGLT